MILPRHMMAQRQQQKQEAVATSIANSSVFNMASDDWATRETVQAQLTQLQDYVTARREEEPTYTLPQPSGWKLMLLILTIPETSAGGVIVIDDAKEARSIASPQGVVLAMGPSAYSDLERFAVNGELTPWHVVGDRIAGVKYDASMFQLANGQRLGFLNDTQPLAKLDGGWTVPE